MKSLRKLTVLSLTIAGFLLAGTVAKADTLTITLDAPFQTSPTGDVVTFDATVTNTDPTNTVYLNGDSTSSSGSTLTIDDTGFWVNFPASLAPGASSGDFELFTVTVPGGTPEGLYTGSFEILGGGPFDSNVVGSVDFNIDVTPEPSSIVLLVTGMAGLAGTLRRRLVR